MVEISSKTPRVTLSGDERIIAYDPSESTPDAKTVVFSRETLLSIVNDLLTGGTDKPLSAAMGALLATRQGQLDAAIQSINDRIDALAGGGGGGPDPVTPTAPVLPPTATFNVPTDYPDDAVAGWVIPLVVGFPQVTYEMAPAIPGVTLGAFGDFILTDAAAYFAAVDADPLDTVLTVSNDLGSSTCDVTFGKMGTFTDLMVGQANMTKLFNALDNDTVFLDELGRVQEWDDLIEPLRKARNDYYLIGRPKRAKSSLMSPTIPALRFQSPSVEQPYGLFHIETPCYHGIQQFRFHSTVGNRMAFTVDDNFAGRAGANFPEISGTPSLLGRPLVLTVYWDTAGLISLRVNGVFYGSVAMSTLTSAYDWDLPKNPGVALAVVYSIALSNSQCMISDMVGIGNNGWTWKRGNFTGDIGFIVSFCNVTPKFPHPAEDI